MKKDQWDLVPDFFQMRQHMNFCLIWEALHANHLGTQSAKSGNHKSDHVSPDFVQNYKLSFNQDSGERKAKLDLERIVRQWPPHPQPTMAIVKHG